MNELDPVATVSDGICALLPRLRRFACAIAGHPADADDLLRVAIERALRHYAQWRPETPLQYWLFGIIRHAWLDEVRAQRRRRQLFVSAAEGEGEQVGDSPMERQQEWIAVPAAMAQLPDEQRWRDRLGVDRGIVVSGRCGGPGDPDRHRDQSPGTRPRRATSVISGKS